MKLNAVAVTSSNIKATTKFYELLGFKFAEFDPTVQHIEPITPDGATRLMIDTQSFIEEMIGEKPFPPNTSMLAILYDSVDELDKIVSETKQAGFTVVKEPWDAFWGQRYAIVKDPDGYLVDLFAYLPK